MSKKGYLFHLIVVILVFLVLPVSSCVNMFEPKYLDKVSDPSKIPSNDPAYAVNVLSDPEFIDVTQRAYKLFSETNLDRKILSKAERRLKDEVEESVISLIDYISTKEALIKKLRDFKNATDSLLRNSRRYEYVVKVEGEAKDKLVKALVKLKGLPSGTDTEELYIDFRDILLLRAQLEPILITYDNKNNLKQPISGLKVRSEVKNIINSNDKPLDKLKNIAKLKGNSNKLELVDLFTDDSLIFKLGKYLVDMGYVISSSVYELYGYEKLNVDEKGFRKDGKVTITTFGVSKTEGVPVVNPWLDKKVFDKLDSATVDLIVSSLKIEGLSLNNDTRWIDVVLFLNNILKNKGKFAIDLSSSIEYMAKDVTVINFTLKGTLDFGRLYTDKFDLKINNLGFDVGLFTETNALLICAAISMIVDENPEGLAQLLIVLDPYTEVYDIGVSSLKFNLNFNDAIITNFTAQCGKKQ